MTGPAWLAAERAGTYGVGPGAGWDLPWLDGDGAPPTSPSARCRRCRYRTAARGHAVACGPAPVVLTWRAHAAAGGLR